MAVYQLKDKELFRIEDNYTRDIYYGSNQEWYLKRWQRMAGCGPSSATNMIYYYNKQREEEQAGSVWTKDQYLILMNDLWRYVTPSFGGVSSTVMFRQGLDRYLDKNKVNLRLSTLDIPKKVSERPQVQQVLAFITEALSKDSPVAFLNLEHGTIEELDSWHWVTIISMEYQEGDNTAYTDILDGGLIKRIDLLEWFRTTKMGGGFVSYQEI